MLRVSLFASAGILAISDIVFYGNQFSILSFLWMLCLVAGFAAPKN